MSEAVDDSVDVIEVLPYEASDACILWDCFVNAFGHFIARCGAPNGCVVYKGFCNVWDLRFENECDITVENCNSVCRALR